MNKKKKKENIFKEIIIDFFKDLFFLDDLLYPIKKANKFLEKAEKSKMSELSLINYSLKSKTLLIEVIRSYSYFLKKHAKDQYFYNKDIKVIIEEQEILIPDIIAKSDTVTEIITEFEKTIKKLSTFRKKLSNNEK